MVAERRDGNESSYFNGWLRKQGKLGVLPSRNAPDCYSSTDVDMCWTQHQRTIYPHAGNCPACGLELMNKQKVCACGLNLGIDSKSADLVLFIEAKTFNKDINDPSCHAQKLILQSIDQMVMPRSEIVYFGVFVLQMNGSCPDSSSSLQWGRINKPMRRISRDELLSILKFNIHPETFEELDKDAFFKR